MKYLLFIFLLCGCSETQTTHKKYGVSITNGTGMNYSNATIDCDSFKMDGNKKVTIWNDGVKMNIECDNHITPFNYN